MAGGALAWGEGGVESLMPTCNEGICCLALCRRRRARGVAHWWVEISVLISAATVSTPYQQEWALSLPGAGCIVQILTLLNTQS